MGSLVTDWLGMLAGGGGGMPTAPPGTAAAAAASTTTATADEFDLLRELVLARFDPAAVARASEEAARARAAAADADAAAPPPPAPEEGDPDADAALSALCGGARGRALVLRLVCAPPSAPARPPCPPLGRAAERMLELGGRAAEEEVAAAGAGAALAPYFGAFQMQLAARLAAFLRAAGGGGGGGGPADGEKCEALARELRATCCESLHAYLLAQALIARAAQAAKAAANTAAAAAAQGAAANAQGGWRGAHAAADGGEARRLAQELELEAAARHGAGSVWPLRRMYAREGAGPRDAEATALVGEVLAAAGEWRPPLERHRRAHHHLHPGDGGGRGGSRTPPPAAPPPPIQRAGRPLARLLEIYSRPLPPCPPPAAAAGEEEEEVGHHGDFDPSDLPSLEPLRHPELLDLLLAALFSATPTAPAASPELRACRRLLALALARASDDGGGGGDDRADGPTPEQLEPAIAEAAALSARCAAQGPGAGQGKPRPGGREFAAAERAAAASPALALALARVARAALGSGPLYADDRCALSAAALLELLRVAARAQPALCGPLAVGGVDAALRASARSGRGLEVGRLALALLLELIVTSAAASSAPPLAAGVKSSGAESGGGGGGFPGLGAPALELAVRWAGGEPDAPLLRQFALALLSCAAPPYSPAFCLAGLRLTLTARLVGRGGGGGAMRAGGGGGGGGGLTPEQRGMLASFCQACRAMRPPLALSGGEERAAFDDLCRALMVA